MKEGGGLLLISDVITSCLSIPCYVLMGANLAPEVAAENYCEATIGDCPSPAVCSNALCSNAVCSNVLCSNARTGPGV